MLDHLVIVVVIPAFRVEEQITWVLERMPPFVDVVHVVDDASPDRTSERVRAHGDPRVVLHRHERNQGVGGAMVTGFLAALDSGADIIIKCDGDAQMDPADIERLVEPLRSGDAEYAKGCRFHHLAELRQMPRARLAGNVALTFLTKLASGYWHVLDPQNGFVAVRAEVLRLVPVDRLARDYFFENDLLMWLNAIEARVADVPLPARYGDEKTSLRMSRVLRTFPPRLLSGALRRLLLRYVFYDVSPVFVFALSGGLLMALGIGYGLYYWITNLRNGRATPAGTVIVAALPTILGFQLLLQAIVLDVHGSPRAGGLRPMSLGREGSGEGVRARPPAPGLRSPSAARDLPSGRRS
jgi:dolichol-phosphate mannosyltransferase